MDFAHKIRAPDADTCKNADAFAGWLTDQMILVYQGSTDRNCLHFIQGVTSTWALAQILPEFEAEEFKFGLVRIHVCALLANYVAKGHPR